MTAIPDKRSPLNVVNVFHVNFQELKEVYLHQCTEMLGNYTLNEQFCLFLVVIHHPRSQVAQAKRTIHLSEYNYCKWWQVNASFW